MKTLTSFLLCLLLLNIAVLAKAVHNKPTSKTVYANKLNFAYPVVLNTNTGLPFFLPLHNEQTIALAGKIVAGKFIPLAKKSAAAALDPSVYYVVFGYQAEGEDGYDIRLQLGQGSEEYGIVSVNAPVNIIANVTGTTSEGSVTANVTLLAGTNRTDLGIFDSTTLPVLYTNSINVSSVTVGGIVYPVEIQQFYPGW